MYYVYVLVSEEGKTYLGYTSDLKRRLQEHNEGKNRWTRGHRWRLVYYEAYASNTDARRRERNLKRSGQARRWLRERIRESVK